jgi:predicted component of type VI protein secretion system
MSMTAEIILRVLDGADRGRTFEQSATPVTIGREEGNSIQLNDERVSRYHIKIQEDHEKVVLTDLESTNGTKVNGEDIQLKILRYGDMISVGRSVLLFGSPDQIAGRLAQIKGRNGDFTFQASDVAEVEQLEPEEFGSDFNMEDHAAATLGMLPPPEPPDRLSPGQAAQLSEMLEYIHLRMRSLLDSVKETGKDDRVSLELTEWQELLALQSVVANYLKDIGDPNS